MTETIHLTENAVKRVYALMEEEGDMNLYLRAYVVGGGCHGFQYGFSFEDSAQEDDVVIEVFQSDVLVDLGHSKSEKFHSPADTVILKVVIDDISMQYLQGAKIDYVDDVSGERFVIKNPQAKVTCGCDRSFAV